MSKQTIAEKAQQIRQETKQYGNTRERIANVLDDLNETKADKDDLKKAINDGLIPLQKRVTNVEEANSKLQTSLRNESKERVNEDNALQTAIDDEVNARQKADDFKLNKPTTKGTTSSHPFVVGVDENNESAKLPAGDLGKNISNTDLKIPEGTARVLDVTGASFAIKGLPSAQGDAEYYFRHKVKSNGEIGVVNESLQIKEDALKAMQLMSDAEKDAYRLASRKVGENYSLGSPIVYSISPPVQKKESGKVKTFILRGNALYLNPNTTRISAIPVGVVENPNTYAGEIPCKSFFSPTDGNILRVDFDSDNLQQDVDYNIIIWVDSPNLYKHRTASKIKLAANIIEIDFSGLTWEKVVLEGKTDTKSFGVGQSVLLDISEYGYDYRTNNATPVLKMLSSKFAESDDNFYLKINLSINLSNTGPTQVVTAAPDFFGVVNNNNNNLINDIQNGFQSTRYDNGTNPKSGSAIGSRSVLLGTGVTVSTTLEIIKENTTITSIVGNSIAVKDITSSMGYFFSAIMTNKGAVFNPRLEGTIEGYKF